MTRRADLIRFYDILGDLERRLGGKRLLADCNGRMDWPARGVYFFFEDGEYRADSGDTMRVVRVGTHALTQTSQTTLWNRLSQHRGTATGGGNHRGSIFRLVVGAAIKARNGWHEPASWGIANDLGKAARKFGKPVDEVKAEEQRLEQLVGEYIRAMPFLWVSVEDAPGGDNARAVIERNSIALLSNFNHAPLDAPSPAWLGRFSDRQRVRTSGLWNNNHVDETYQRAFLDQLERLVGSHG